MSSAEKIESRAVAVSGCSSLSDDRIDQLEKRIATLSDDRIDQLEKRIATLENQIAILIPGPEPLPDVP